MKKLYILTIMLCIGLMSCNSNQNEDEWADIFGPKIENKDIVCCGVRNPQQNLPWLAKIIKKANLYDDQHLGTIWLENYKGKDIIVTDMGLGSGGVMYWIFDCSGNNIASEIEISFLEGFYEGLSTRLNVIIYSNFSKY